MLIFSRIFAATLSFSVGCLSCIFYMNPPLTLPRLRRRYRPEIAEGTREYDRLPYQQELHNLKEASKRLGVVVHFGNLCGRPEKALSQCIIAAKCCSKANNWQIVNTLVKWRSRLRGRPHVMDQLLRSYPILKQAVERINQVSVRPSTVLCVSLYRQRHILNVYHHFNGRLTVVDCISQDG